MSSVLRRNFFGGMFGGMLVAWSASFSDIMRPIGGCSTATASAKIFKGTLVLQGFFFVCAFGDVNLVMRKWACRWS
jgi:hypothetical protein